MFKSCFDNLLKDYYQRRNVCFIADASEADWRFESDALKSSMDQFNIFSLTVGENTFVFCFLYRHEGTFLNSLLFINVRHEESC